MNSNKKIMWTGLALFAVSFLLLFGREFLLNCKYGYIFSDSFLKLVDESISYIGVYLLYLLFFSYIIFILGLSLNSETTRKKVINFIILLILSFILGTIVLSSFNRARYKSPDSYIKSELSQIRAYAEKYYDLNKSYGEPTSSCYTKNSLFDNAEIREIISKVEYVSDNNAQCNSNKTSYAIAVPLKSLSPNKGGRLCKEIPEDKILNWCIDNLGNQFATKFNLTESKCQPVRNN